MTDYRQRPAQRPRSPDLGFHDLLTIEQAAQLHLARLAERGWALEPYRGGYRIIPKRRNVA